MDWIYDIFEFSKKYPLDFTQMSFWIFFVIVYAGFALTYKRLFIRNLFLFLVSCFFYYKTSGLFVMLLLFSTVTDFYFGRQIDKSQDEGRRKLFVTLSVCLNLFVLSYFKYAYFFTDAYNTIFHTDHKVFNYLAYWGNGFHSKGYFSVDEIVLPVGISFYTFQTISYTVDIYRRKLKSLDSILDFGLYVTFFPQLVAGPIVRAEEFVPQLLRPTQITKEDFNRATYFIFKGLIKKMLFANFIAVEFLDRVFEMPTMYSGFTNLMALVGYSLQVYGDFAGYTDIAIGLALLMGFELPRNFNSPYKAINTGDFWKRWHISLSTWLKDYLYIPLGGNRTGSWASVTIALVLVSVALIGVGNPYFSLIIGLLLLGGTLLAMKSERFQHYITTNINLMLTMVLGGLWHGASWKYILWGGINGLGIVFYKLWRKVSPYEHSTHWLAHFWKVFSTFIFIVFVRLYFRGEDMERIGQFYDQLWNNMDLSSSGQVLWYFRDAFAVIVLGYTVHWLPQSLKDKIEEAYYQSPIWVKALIMAVVAVICYQTFSNDAPAFIYFQF
ncbi:MBOAT family protein [Capnocytophaga sp. oral taxon 863 str. F0517]|jgi:alginate O-acetylation protein|uniref:MBOAT family O-acyltransferase n=1 Tax=Capnocytophaga sp. oral taxon 863 TaxID=1227265 RepID=UPI0003962A1D|nr:MBOAT family O-acyltransferase [Capnocytophaga sp. oral taxon 863]ERI62793.1 MBOAT family protein [Capnocytophaga sp. oral taxon 863 str. F0517]